jgi:hypothetical protein
MPASRPPPSRRWPTGINIRAITTSEIKFSMLIDAAYTELAVRTLHSVYGLDGLRKIRRFRPSPAVDR